MDYMAKWGPKGFVVTPSKIITLSDLSTSMSLKRDSENDTSGTAPTNTRGRELRPIEFSATYVRAAGVDPRAQLEEWESLLGEKYPLIIGGKQFGPESMILTSVEASNIELSDKGVFLSVEVKISLEEDSTTNTSEVTKKKSSSTKRKTTKSTKDDEKKKSLSTTASARAKETKKPSGVVTERVMMQ